MSTIEDFENAPIGATATRPGVPVAVKVSDRPRIQGIWDDGLVKMTVETLVDHDYILDPSPAPTTAREALDLAWDLAHPVKVGQAVPAGAEIISVRSEIERTYGTTLADQVADSFDELHTRTLDPLPDPEPDWLDAPAVIAVCNDTMDRTVFARENETGTQWLRDTKVYRWDELIDVVPLYPKEGDGRMSHDETIERAAKTMHAEFCCPCDPQGCDWICTREARYAVLLAEAGMLARPLPTKEEIADELSGWPIGTGYYQTQVAIDEAQDMADAVLELLKGQDR